MTKHMTKVGAMFLGLGILAAADVASAANFTLVEGIYDGVVTMEPEGESFCKFGGGATRFPHTYILRMPDESTVELTIIVEVDGMTIPLEYRTCSIVGRTLDCGEKGADAYEDLVFDMRPYGVDAIWTQRGSHETVDILVSPTEFVGHSLPRLHTCEGTDCDMLAGWNGPEWSFPCLEAPWGMSWTLRQ